jgi:prolipoprotein diacylglyceryltransferase
MFLLGLIIFLKIRTRYHRQEGDLFKFYAIAYLSFRLLIDFIKPDFHPLLGISPIQIACILGILYYYRSISRFLTFTRSSNSLS